MDTLADLRVVARDGRRREAGSDGTPDPDLVLLGRWLACEVALSEAKGMEKRFIADEWWRSEQWKFRRSQVTKFEREARCGVIIVRHPAYHDMFVSNAGDVAALIGAFLASLAQDAKQSASARSAVPAQARKDMRTALLTLFHAEETYFFKHGAYSAQLDTVLREVGAKLPDRVVLKITLASPRGWQASSADARWPEGSCVIFLGDLGSVALGETKKGQRLTAAKAGQPLCDWP